MHLNKRSIAWRPISLYIYFFDYTLVFFFFRINLLFFIWWNGILSYLEVSTGLKMGSSIAERGILH
jgi:hypothetical protein